MAFELFSLNTHQRPKLACEITPEGVIAARQSGAADSLTTSFVPLFPGALVPGLKTPNLPDRAAIVAALKRALDGVEGRDKRLTLVVPDAAARVLLLDFDSLPGKVSEALPVVRFRLRKLLPFNADEAIVSYQIMSQTSDEAKVLVTAMPKDVLTEYEEAVRLAGYEPGVVLPSMLASLAVFSQTEPALLINRNGNSVTTAISRGEELLLHRSLDLAADSPQREEDLRQAVSVSVAYFEDTLSSMPDVVFYAGPGGAVVFSQVLGLEQFRVRDLVSTAVIGTGNTVPGGLMAGVSGALTN